MLRWKDGGASGPGPMRAANHRYAAAHRPPTPCRSRLDRRQSGGSSPGAASTASRPAEHSGGHGIGISAASPRPVHRTRRSMSSARMVRAAFRQQQQRGLYEGLPFPTGYGLGQAFGTSPAPRFRLGRPVTFSWSSVPTHRRAPGLRLPAQAQAASRRTRRRRCDGSSWSAHPCARRLSPGAAGRMSPSSTPSPVVVTEVCDGISSPSAVRSRATSPSSRGEHARNDRRGHRRARRTSRRRRTGYTAGPNSAVWDGLGVTEHSQGSTMVMGWPTSRCSTRDDQPASVG